YSPVIPVPRERRPWQQSRRQGAGGYARPPGGPVSEDLMPALLLLATAIISQQNDPPRGYLVIVGGGPNNPDILRKARELAGGPAARVLIVPQASGLPNAGELSSRMWQAAGAKQVTVLDLGSPGAALEGVRSATLIWLVGGDQNRLVRALHKT